MTDYADLEKRLRDWADAAREQGDGVSLEASPNFSAEMRTATKAGFYAQEALLREAADASGDVRGLAGLLERALEELRLIRMKDCGAVYDVTLRLDMAALLDRYRKEQGQGISSAVSSGAQQGDAKDALEQKADRHDGE